MIAIPRTKCGIPFHDVFFSVEPKEFPLESHLAHFSQAAKPLAGFTACQTKIVDLALDSGVLFAKLSSSTRYKIRRAEREGITPSVTIDPSDNTISAFCSHFDTFARSKKLPLSNRNKLVGLREKSALLIAHASETDGSALVTHAYIADRESARIRLLYSASHFRSTSDTEERNRIGRANRLLHWHLMHTSQSYGYRFYDLGGFPIDQSDPEKNAIARFKSEFGGETVAEYNGFASRHRLIQQVIPTAQRIFSQRIFT